MDTKADIRAQTMDSKWSALHVASIKGMAPCLGLLISAGGDLEALAESLFTPLAKAIAYNEPQCAELLMDAGAKLDNVHKDINIPSWVRVLISKRQNVRRTLLVFMGVLRRRFTVQGRATSHIGGHLPRDIVGELAFHVWATRLDPQWIPAAEEKKIKRTKGKLGQLRK